MSFYEFPRYVSVGEKKARAEKKLRQLKKKNPDIAPITIQGRSLATTWWGIAWNKNLEKYADYSNRIGRGRSYVRHSAVLDLQIAPGKVKALVQGSAAKPYSVSVVIKGIPKKNWAEIKKACAGKMESMQQLIAGKFPEELAAIFTEKGSGLFPAPGEIEFECSCPDWAYMCKHVAATLYGIGTRLDDDPHLFFLLRKVNVNDLISETIRESKNELLSKAKKKTSRVIEDNDALSDIFGIDLGAPEKATDRRKKTAPKLKPVKKAAVSKPTKKKPTNKKQVKQAKPDAPAKPSESVKKRKSKKMTASGRVEQIIKKHKKGIRFDEVAAKSGFDDQKVRNIIYRLKKQGKINSIAWGVYRSADQ